MDVPENGISITYIFSVVTSLYRICAIADFLGCTELEETLNEQANEPRLSRAMYPRVQHWRYSLPGVWQSITRVGGGDSPDAPGLAIGGLVGGGLGQCSV